MPTDRYHCPDHFVFERKHPHLLAAWAVGLLFLVLALSFAGMR